MSFFDALPAPEPPAEPEYRPPPWAVPPENVLPRAVALDAVLARSDDGAAYIAGALAYPQGVVLDVVIVQRQRASAREQRYRPFFMGPGEPEGPRFGVGFADGRKAVVGRPWGTPDIDRETHAVLSPIGGGGSGRRWDARLWLWPLPPAGPLTLAFAWPEDGVDETTMEIDAAPIVAAAAKATELWPDDRPPGPPED